MRHLLNILFASILVCSIAGAQSPGGESVLIQTGQQYEAATRVKDEATGISFVIPADWIGGMPANSEAFLLGSNTIAGVGLVFIRSQSTLEQAEQLLNTAQDLGDGVILQPAAPVKRGPGSLEIDYAGGNFTGKVVVKISSAGSGAAVFWAGPAADKQRYDNLAGQVAASLQFGNPVVSSKTQEWDAWLRGKMLRQLSSSSSYGYGDQSYTGSSSSTTLHLCSNGRYSYYSSSSFAVDAGDAGFGYSGGGASGSDSNSDAGTWRVEGRGGQTLLVVTSDKGDGDGVYVLSTNEQDHTLVDGERYFCVPSDGCN